MPAKHEPDELDRWLDQQVQPLAPPPGTFELVTRRARRRKIRRALLSAASAAAVAAAVAVAVPLSSSLRLNTTPTNASLEAGATATTNASAGQRASAVPSTTSNSQAVSSSSPTSTQSPGYLPSDYMPQSVTWDSTSTGWVLGPAGTPGHCANTNPDICTSIARTDDGGQTWQGLPAPPTTGVTRLRFLNANDGWAFGPQLWATTDGGQHWHQVNTGNMCVDGLETVNGRAYALFDTCTAASGTARARYTLMTAVAGSDNWTPVAGVPANLTESSGPTDLASIELSSGTGYLVTPDDTLYSGPLDGTAWHLVGGLPCGSEGVQPEGEPLLTPVGTPASGAQHLAVACATIPAKTITVYRSPNGGTTWGATATYLPAATIVPESMAALPDGTLILAAVSGSGATYGSGGGIYFLSPGATQWQAATVADPGGQGLGFTYVGMTSATQGVAISEDPSLHGIWMTMDGGRTWTLRQIKA